MCPFSMSGFFSMCPFGSELIMPNGPSTIRGPLCAGIDSSSFHQRGLASILHRTHLRTGLGIVGSLDSSLTGIPAFDCRPRAEVGVWAVTADARRLTCAGVGWGTIRVDWSTRLALRAVPVRVKSACLNSRANSCSAIRSVPSTSSFIG